MAGVSTKEIKNRIRSMESTKQITKAMEMVAASKLRRAQNEVNNARPYFRILHAVIQDIAGANKDFESVYLRPERTEAKKVAYIVIAGDRGLAGGYNSNILKMCYQQMTQEEVSVLPIGKKTVEFFKARGVKLLTENYQEAGSVSVGDCFSIAKNLASAFKKKEYDEIRIGYTNFVSVLSQTPEMRTLLPLVKSEEASGEKKAETDIVYEPNSVEVFDAIIPEYIGGILYGALCESRAAEQAARRTAMDSATQNADEMIADLNLKFNRARQAAITQEITEIVAGT